MSIISWQIRRKLRRRLKESRRLLEANRDRISKEKAESYAADLEELKTAVEAKELLNVEEMLGRMERLEERFFPRPPHAGWQELVDIVLVAGVVAFGGVRTFFVQPFKIPSASMAPTLVGVEPKVRTEPVPSVPVRLLDRVLYGRRYIEIISTTDGQFDPYSIREVSRKSWLPFLKRRSVEFTAGGQAYVVDLERSEFNKIQTQLPSVVYAGKPILRIQVDAGDHLLVDRFTYNFRLPQRGEITVFDTADLPVRNMGQFYIKRLNGLGGDVLRVEPPYLFVNGKVADGRRCYERIYSQQRGYHGYTLAPEGDRQYLLTQERPEYRVPRRNYFLMGDNSKNSADSRYWGPIGTEKFIGKAWVVYWPLSKRFGLAE